MNTTYDRRKQAELLTTASAGVLGAGIALVFADQLRTFAYPLLILGIVAHAWGMSTGLYARIRHPQYVGFVLILLGFLFQWPTLLTLGMFPILLYMYYRLAIREEQDMIAQFGDEYRQYKAHTPAFFPHLGQPAQLSKK